MEGAASSSKKRRAEDGAADAWGAMKKYVLFVLKEHGSLFNENDDRDYGGLWDELPESLKHDCDVASLAVAQGCCAFEDLPSNMSSDNRNFMLALLKLKGQYWRELPPNFKDDPAFASVITKPMNRERHVEDNWKFEEVCREVATRFPRDTNVWANLMDQGQVHLLEEYADEAVRSDRTVLMRACIASEGEALVELTDNFRQNRLFVEELLAECPLALACLDQEQLLLFHDLVTQNLKLFFDALAKEHNRLSRREGRATYYHPLKYGQLARKLDPEVWNDRAFTLLWFRSGGPFVGGVHPKAWKSNREIIFAIAKYCRPEWLGFIIGFKASQDFRGDKEIMLTVLGRIEERLVSFVFFRASNDLQSDTGLIICALSRSEDFVEEFWRRNGNDSLNAVEIQVRERLDLHENFVKLILCGVALSDFPDSVLSLLNQGEATSLMYKKLIAEYVGVPTGEQLRELRQALKNIEVAKEQNDSDADSDSE